MSKEDIRSITKNARVKFDMLVSKALRIYEEENKNAGEKVSK